MKKSLAIPGWLMLACMVPFASLAQSPSQPTYEKKVYIADDGKIYVQKSLPMYLKFSTSPNGGTDYNLKSKNNYGNPMYLDTEGVNYVRSKWAVDPETGKTVVPQQEVLYPVYADGLSPRTTIRFSGAPKYVSGGTVFYGKGLTFDLTSKDGVSGVENTHYSLNQGSYSNYSGTVTSNKEGTNNLYFYANDMVGNAEKSNSRSYTVDLSAPKSSHEIVGIHYNGNILAPSASFRLSKTDNLSGVRSTYYTYDAAGRKVYGSSPVSPGYLPDGDHTLYYWSIDNVKNEETRQSFKFYLDKIPPVVTATIIGDQYKGNYTYVSSRTKINLDATDNKAGVEQIYYRIDGKERVDYASQFNLPNVKGTHSIKYDATDNVKNLSPNKYLNVYVDNVAPTTGIDYGRPQFFARDTLFINKNTALKLFAKDYESGVQKIEYNVDGGSFKPYSEFTIPSEGFHKIQFKSTDRVNNTEVVKESECFVDNTPPKIYVNFSIKPIGSKKKGGQDLKVYPNYTRMYIGATDAHCGTDVILYSLNGGPMTPYSSPQSLDISEVNRFKKNTFYSVKVVTKDKLGNQSEQVFEFFVGK